MGKTSEIEGSSNVGIHITTKISNKNACWKLNIIWFKIVIIKNNIFSKIIIFF